MNKCDIEQAILDAGIVMKRVRLVGPVQALYVRRKGTSVIAVSEDLAPGDYVFICAEELGHHHTSAGDLLMATQENYQRQEALALQWARQKIAAIDAM